MSKSIGFVLATCAGISLFNVDTNAAEQKTLSDRITHLEDRLADVQVQLGKLDFIVDSVKAMRTRDLTTIQRDLRGMHPTSGLGPSDGTAGSDPQHNSAIKPADDTRQQSTVETPPAARTDDGLLAERARHVEHAISTLEGHLEKIDDIAEQIDSMRNEDLAKIQRDIRRVKQTSGTWQSSTDTSRAADSGPSSRIGSVVINNHTGVTHTVSVNSRDYRARPGKTVVQVPYGAVVTGLPRYGISETWGTEHWKKVGNDYQIALNLNN